MILEYKTTLEQIERFIKNIGKKAYDEHNSESHICYAVYTCWWCLLADHPGYKKGPIPCDPRGSVLLQAPAGIFIDNVKKNPGHYGMYFLDTFMAAYHGNVTTDDGQPTSLESWKEYEELVKEYLNE
jgi:hypothetical protein